MTDQYPHAWTITHPDSPEDGVLIRKDYPGTGSYWWFLCPADATLYVDDVNEECHMGIECLWTELHREAARLSRKVRVQ